MQDNVSDSEHPERPGLGDNTGGLGGNEVLADPAGNAGEPAKTWRRRTVVLGAYAAAAAIFTGIGFGSASVMRGQVTSAAASSAIPSPPPQNQRFVEDDNGTGADSQANILQSTVPGLVRIVSSRGTGAGVVLTPSGLVLTSAQIARGSGKVTAEIVTSGRSLAARIVGSDPGRGLALLQLEGGSAFTPAAIGNARDFAVGAAVTSVGASATRKAYTLDIGNLASANAATAIDGRRLAGLMRTTARIMPGEGIGGPLVNLSGQMIGLDLGGSAHGVDVTGYAVPINDALATARQLDATQR